MKQSVAVGHLRVMMAAIQKFRSIVQEHHTDDVAADLFPWMMGPKCPLPALGKVLDSVDGGAELAPMDYYNMMIVATMLAPEINLLAGEADLPRPDSQWLHGWEAE